MDQVQFDKLTRSTASDAGTRRTLLRLLAGVTLSLVTARLGLAQNAEANKKRRRKPQANRKQQGHLGAEGKGKRKQKRHKKPLPPQPCDLFCTDGGGRCCPDGSCVYGECCAGEKPCHDSLDGSCIPQDQCCPEERTCADGSCVPLTECCREQRECPNACLPMDECCPGQKRCGNRCLQADLCCEDDLFPLCNACQEAVCVNGNMVCGPVKQCPTGKYLNADTCQCECPEGYADCGSGHCNCEVRVGVVCQSGLCCAPLRHCPAAGACCYGWSSCTPEGCCPPEWIHDGHCIPPGS